MSKAALTHYDFSLDEVLAALSSRMRDQDHARGITFKFNEKGVTAQRFFHRIRIIGERMMVDVFEERPEDAPDAPLKRATRLRPDGRG